MVIKMKKIVLVTFLLCTLTIALTACGKEQKIESNNTQENKTESTQTAVVEDSDVFSQVSGILGKNDSEVQDQFGSNTMNMDEENNALLGRSYNLDIYDETVPVEIIYNDAQTVVAVSMNFQESSYDKVLQGLESLYGEGTKIDQTSELENKYMEWSTDTITINLTNSYGTTAVQFALNEQ